MLSNSKLPSMDQGSLEGHPPLNTQVYCIITINVPDALKFPAAKYGTGAHWSTSLLSEPDGHKGPAV